MRLLGIVFLLFCVGNLLAQSKDYEIKRIQTHLKIDGLVNEAEWGLAHGSGNFWQQFPYDTSLSLTQTEFKILYNDHGIYVALYCYERNTSRENVIQSLKRDFSVTNSDAVIFSLAPFGDGQNGYSFGVNPKNAQREGVLENGGMFGVTTAWDQVWFSETAKVSDSLWTAELFIPFKSIRYAKNLEEWQFNVQRVDMKNNEKSCYVKVPRNLNISSLNSYAILKFEKKLPSKKSKNLTLIPYVGLNASGNAKKFFNSSKEIFGGDIKFGLTSSLNLDLTVNPDFAQVEVDVQQINLTQYNLFYPERRQFFLENNDLFANFGFSQIRPFFSRQIGLYNGNSVPIIAGARLSGKLDKNWRIGVMNVITDARSDLKLNKKQYSTVALQRRVFKASSIGMIWVNETEITKGYSTKAFSSVGGVEYNLNSTNNKWIGKGFVQRSGFQQWDKNAWAHASFLRYRNIYWRVDWNHEHVGGAFRAPMGYVPKLTLFNPVLGQTVYRTFSRLEPAIARAFYPKRNKLINNYYFELYNSSYYTKNFEPFESTSKFTYGINFQNSAILTAYLGKDFIDLLVPFRPIVPTKAGAYLSGKYHWSTAGIYFSSNVRKRVSGSAELSNGTYYTNGSRLYLNGVIQYRFQPYGFVQFTGRRDYIKIDSFGSSVIDLFGVKTEFTIKPTLYFTVFLQYNTQRDNININTRFQWRFRPMSDLFIVYMENYNSAFDTKDRLFSVKLVYWLNMSLSRSFKGISN